MCVGGERGVIERRFLSAVGNYKNTFGSETQGYELQSNGRLNKWEERKRKKGRGKCGASQTEIVEFEDELAIQMERPRRNHKW